MNLFIISISACSKNLEMFEKGILIIRNPLDCFIAEYNRVLQNHFEYAPLRKWNEIENIDEFVAWKAPPNLQPFLQGYLEKWGGLDSTRPLKSRHTARLLCNGLLIQRREL